MDEINQNNNNRVEIAQIKKCENKILTNKHGEVKVSELDEASGTSYNDKQQSFKYDFEPDELTTGTNASQNNYKFNELPTWSKGKMLITEADINEYNRPSGNNHDDLAFDDQMLEFFNQTTSNEAYKLILESNRKQDTTEVAYPSEVDKTLSASSTIVENTNPKTNSAKNETITTNKIKINNVITIASEISIPQTIEQCGTSNVEYSAPPEIVSTETDQSAKSEDSDIDQNSDCASIIDYLTIYNTSSKYNIDVSLDSSDCDSPPGTLLELSGDDDCNFPETWQSMLDALKLTKKNSESRDQIVNNLEDIEIEVPEVEIDIDMIFKEKFHITPTEPDLKQPSPNDLYVCREVDFEVIDDYATSSVSDDTEIEKKKELECQNMDLGEDKGKDIICIDECKTDAVLDHKTPLQNIEQHSNYSINQYLEMFRACAAEIEEANRNDDDMKDIIPEWDEWEQVEQLKATVKTDVVSSIMDHVETFAHNTESKQLKKMVNSAMKKGNVGELTINEITDQEKVAIDFEESSMPRHSEIFESDNSLLNYSRVRLCGLKRSRSEPDLRTTRKRIYPYDVSSSQFSNNITEDGATASKRRSLASHFGINEMYFGTKEKPTSLLGNYIEKKSLKKKNPFANRKPLGYEYGNIELSPDKSTLIQQLKTAFAKFDKKLFFGSNQELKNDIKSIIPMKYTKSETHRRHSTE